MMLGGLGSDGVVIGGRGSDTDTDMGLGASGVAVDVVMDVAGLLSELAEVGVVDPDTGGEAATGIETFGAVDSEVAEAVVGVEAMPALNAGSLTIGVDAVGVAGAGIAALSVTTGRTAVELCIGVAGRVGVGKTADVVRLICLDAGGFNVAGIVALLAVAAGVDVVAGRATGDLFGAMGGRANGTLGWGATGLGAARGRGSLAGWG